MIEKELRKRNLACGVDVETKFIVCIVENNDIEQFPNFSAYIEEIHVWFNVPITDIIEIVFFYAFSNSKKEQSGSKYMVTYKIRVDSYGDPNAVMLGTLFLRSIYMKMEYKKFKNMVELSITPYFLIKYQNKY